MSFTDVQPPEGEGFDLQAVYAENAKPYWFRWADRWWTLPHLRMLDFEKQVKVEEFDFSILTAEDAAPDAAKNAVNELFTLIMGEEQGGEWRRVDRPLPMLLDLIAGWTEHSGAKPGEASASEGSSGSTGRPSKRTSNATTASGSRRRSPAKRAPAAAVKADTRRGNS